MASHAARRANYMPFIILRLDSKSRTTNLLYTQELCNVSISLDFITKRALTSLLIPLVRLLQSCVLELIFAIFVNEIIVGGDDLVLVLAQRLDQLPTINTKSPYCSCLPHSPRQRCLTATRQTSHKHNNKVSIANALQHFFTADVDVIACVREVYIDNASIELAIALCNSSLHPHMLQTRRRSTIRHRAVVFSRLTSQ